jgi:isocitrate dehydrogenase
MTTDAEGVARPAEPRSAHTRDTELKVHFAPVAEQLEQNEEKIAQEFLDAQGKPVDLGGYYLPDIEKAEKVMRTSPTLNSIIDGM